MLCASPRAVDFRVCSIGLVFINKHLLSGIGAELDIPLFITCCQCLVTIGICLVLRWGSFKTKYLKTFSKLDINFETCIDVLPLSIVFVAMISFNNLCLRNVGVAFYYVGRSITTVFTVILTYVFFGDNSTKGVNVSCLVILIGFGIGSDQESQDPLTTSGVLYGMFASLAVALNALYTKSILPKVGNCIWQLTWYNNILAVLLFLPLIIINGDFGKIWNHFPTWSFWQLLFISGIFGFVMNYVTGWQIKATSPLTHNISATAKSASQTVIAVFLYSEVKSYLWWFSNLIILLGSMLYTIAKKSEVYSKLRQLKSN
eukprot:NP_509825.2 Nucleotide Sugar TransPorter family [Caenorhabditis elegans]